MRRKSTVRRYLEERKAERGWRERFNDLRALDALDQLIDEAIAEDEAGETVDLDEVLRALQNDKTVL